jgi:hypothetical protein
MTQPATSIPSDALTVAIDSAATTIATGDDFLNSSRYPEAVAAYKVAASQLSVLPGAPSTLEQQISDMNPVDAGQDAANTAKSLSTSILASVRAQAAPPPAPTKLTPKTIAIGLVVAALSVGMAVWLAKRKHRARAQLRGSPRRRAAFSLAP